MTVSRSRTTHAAHTPNSAPRRLIAATFAPMTPHGDVDLDAVPAYAEMLRESGVRELFVNGTTGESLSLTVEERQGLLAAWCDCWPVGDLFAHVGHDSVRDACRLAGHAAGLGVSRVSAMAPSFFAPADPSQLLEFLKPIASAAGDARFYYYHIPSMTGVGLDMRRFIGDLVESIPTLAGVKYTHEDLVEYAACRSDWGDSLEILFGRDELLLPALSHGADGAVGSFYGLTPHLFVAVWAAVGAGRLDEAARCSLVANQLIEAFKEYGVLPAGKSLLARRGIGSGAVRPPLRPLSRAETERLYGQLDSMASPPPRHPIASPPAATDRGSVQPA
ncbi:MAG: dihydrodipicolinate synthase family protein [Planctomycetota bacterium]